MSQNMKRAWETRQAPAVCHISVLDAVLTKNSHKTCLALLSCPLLCDRDCLLLMNIFPPVQELANILVLYKKENFHFCPYFSKEGKVCK